MDDLVLLLLWVALLSLVLGLSAAIAEQRAARRLINKIQKNLPAFLRKQAE